ncbi:MAG: DUF4175 family protein [Verrucomicrobiota bacterium]
MNPIPEFYQRLQWQRGALLWLLVIVLAFSFLGLFSIAIMVANGLDALDSWQEASAFRFILTLTILAGVAYVAALILAIVKRPSVVSLARAVEDRYPDLNESLSTAVELQMLQGGPQNQLEAALFRSVEERSQELNFRTATLPRRAHPFAIIGIVIASFFLSNWAMESRVMSKARFYYVDFLKGSPSGLIVGPGSVDAPRKSDLLVEAEVTRWEQEAFIEYRSDDGRVERYPMALMGSDQFDFTWYSLDESFAYRVVTPSLESRWFEVGVYEPPEIESLEIAVQPPAYTGEEPLAFERLLDLFVVEGSEVNFKVNVADGVETWLRVGDEETAFEKEITVIAEETTEYQFRMQNDDGRGAVTDRFLLEVKPDEPPTVAIIDPGQDSKAVLDDIVPMEIYAADDYGVSRVEIELSVSGLPRSPIKIFSTDENHPLEHTGLPVLEVGRMGVEFGDVITYFAKAWDNREPDPQVSRSEIYFIEVVEEIDGPEQENEQGGGGGEGGGEQDVDLRAIITELKRLIRNAYQVDLEEGERRTLGSQELGANLAQLATESQGILGQVGGVLGTIEEGLPYEMFLDAIYRMVDAEEAANANLPGDAIFPMQESMSLLIRLEKYLQALFPPQQQGAGGGGGQSESQASGEQPQEEGESDTGMSMADMQDALEEINRLSDEQATMNRRFERAPGQMGESERQELQDLQDEVSEKVETLTDEMSRLRQGGNVRDALRGAAGQMEQAASAAGTGNPDRAERAGSRARRSLMDAAGLLDERIRREATGAIASLAQQAERIAQGQGAAAADSRGAAQGEPNEATKDAMENQQRALNEEWTQLERQMDELTGDLGGVFPEAAEALGQVARQAGQQNVDRNMSRAANALLYERYERAASSQNAAADALANIANQLDEAAGTLPGLSPTELRQLLDRVADARREVAQASNSGNAGESEQSGSQGQEGQAESGQGQEGQAGEGEGQGQGDGEGQGQGQGEGSLAQSGEGQGQGQGQGPGQDSNSPGQGGENGQQPGGQGRGTSNSQSDALGQLGDSLSQAGRALNDDSLVELGSELSAPQAGEGGGGGTTPAAILDSAARVLQEYLRKEIGEQRLRFNREGGPPPEKYRELVEEYFRDLAEEPGQ